MLISKLDEFACAKTITGSSTSTNVIDFGAAGVSESSGYVVVRANSDTHGIATAKLVGSADNSTFVTYGSMDFTDTTAGAIVAIPIPQGMPRYARVDVEGTSLTGTIDAFITTKPSSPRDHRIENVQARASV